MSIEKYKVPQESLTSGLDIIFEKEKNRFEKLLAVDSFKSEKDFYDYIFKLKLFLRSPHDYIPNVEQRVNEKLYYIQKSSSGKEIFDKGIDIYEQHEFFSSFYANMGYNERLKIEQDIITNPKLAEQLSDIRDNPEKYKNVTGSYVYYMAVYCYMVEREMYEKEETTEEKKEEETR